MNLYSKVKVGTNELNDTSWILDKNGEYLPVKDAMPSLLEQGSNYSATVGRVKLLIEELNNDLDYLSNERIISINVHKPSLIDVVVSSNYETNDGKKINPLTDMDGLEKGHIESDAHGGDKSIENITAQEFESNRDYGTMDLIEK